ncbi:DUF6997 domain-containing protein [Thermoflavimicrobium dichotomicum]|uniref:DUF6997 domain-containing protein n=1 Tax=Thermoflavimicrobium dichotomicum TaxID=46223 RepID=A0A1I3RUH5_9BACL|nr:hypothetical protein [Thermoflavimicrobium dichotomicum]SFJ50214.1 hypothetical protein SAMN05421852_11142 [Thermoflavimicrobium dichotomicum]
MIKIVLRKTYASTDIFEPIAKKLEDKEIFLYGPLSFKQYLKEYNLPNVQTASNISIDFKEKLHKSLRKNNAMILRLGRSNDNRSTQFCIVKGPRLDDFFIMDKNIFSEHGEYFIPKHENSDLSIYRLFPKLTEGSFVNLAFASGLLNYALDLDSNHALYPPMTCRSTFSFQFKPHTLIDIKLEHREGQVEIDSMFIEKRKGQPTLFILEAKQDRNYRSLAKHKLVYPSLALASQLTDNIPIVPVYLKVTNSIFGIHYHIVECFLPDPRKKIISLDELQVKKYTHLIIPLDFFEK